MVAQRVPPDIFYLDQTPGRALQVRIREAIIASILNGQVETHSRMPSSRKLAQHLGVSRMTVTLAMQDLVAQGYLEAKDRSAYVVAEPDLYSNATLNSTADITRSTTKIAPPPSQKLDWNKRLNNGLLDRRRIEKPAGWRNMEYPFIYGQMDQRLFNLAAWRDCTRQATGFRDFHEAAGDMHAFDDPMLINFIRARILPRRGITAKTDEIMLTVGAQNAIWLTAELLTRSKAKVLCEEPGYPDSRHALRWCGAEVVTAKIDSDGLPPDAITDDIDAVFVTPSHHAPTGLTMPHHRRLELLAKADEKDFVIVEDDYEFEMAFKKAPSPALKALDENDRVIYIGSFSKALFPGLRIGYLVGPPEFIAEARELRSMMLRHPPGLLQRTVAYFLAQGHYDNQIREMRTKFSRRHAYLHSALAREKIGKVHAAEFGGSSLWVELKPKIDTVHLAHSLQKVGVLIEPGAPFFTRKGHPRNFMRLGYSSIPAKKIDMGVRKIAQHLRMLER